MMFSSRLHRRLEEILFSPSEPSFIRGTAVVPVFFKYRSIETRKGLLDKCVPDHDSYVRVRAINFVASHYTRDYDESLLQLLCDDDSEVSEAAAQTLIQHGDVVTVGILRNLLNTNISKKTFAAIRNTIAAIEQKFLFSVDLKFQRDLDHAIILESLRREFENKGKSLSKNAHIFIDEPGNRWRITATGGDWYLIGRDGNRLNIYLRW
jgi:hypothetical protein